MRRIRRITLQNFRTYGFLDFSLPGKSVALTGANGVGKTNLIEALSLMSPGRGMRRAKLDEIAQQGSSGDWGIGLSLKEDDNAEAVQLALQIRHDAPTKKLCRVNGDPVPTIGRFAEYIRFTWLTPAQDRLFMEGAAERRRFLDRMVLAQNTAHAQVSSAYEKAMRQRQAILADPSDQDPQLLDVLEGQMAQNAVAIAVGRSHMADILREGYKALHEGAFPNAQISLQGTLEEALAKEGAEEVQAKYQQNLHGARRRDAQAGRCLLGPHRSDLFVMHDQKQQPARLCSTGEQKALLIGLVLAHAAALHKQSEIPLILLLDEVAAHLDEDRRAALADILDSLDCQAFMTGTDASLFTPWGVRATHLQVQQGGDVVEA